MHRGACEETVDMRGRREGRETFEGSRVWGWDPGWCRGSVEGRNDGNGVALRRMVRRWRYDERDSGERSLYHGGTRA